MHGNALILKFPYQKICVNDVTYYINCVTLNVKKVPTFKKL